MGLPSLLESETLPTPREEDRPDGVSPDVQARLTLDCWVERFLAAAAEPTCPQSIDAQREALSMLFPDARVAGVSLVPPLKVGPEFPGSLGLLLVPDSLDYHESELSAAIRRIIDASDWTAYSNGLLRASVLLGNVEAHCTLVVARAVDHATLLSAARRGF